MADRKTVIQQLVHTGEEVFSKIPQVSTLPRGKEQVIASFVVSDPDMTQMAARIGLDAGAVIGMVNGESWHGIHLKPIDAALLAPAFEPEQQKRIAAALELAQRVFWEEQHFYFDEMAATQAGDIPNALMRETSLAIEERAVACLRQRLSAASQQPVVWVDYAAGPASFVNGALHRLRTEGIDLSRMVVVLVEPAKHFREFAQQQPILRELREQGRLYFVEGLLEDGETYDRVETVLQETGASKADIVTQAFGASYVADHLRPAMWQAMLGTAKPQGLKLVVATTDKYNPSRMIRDRLRDEIAQRMRERADSRLTVSAIPAAYQGFCAWISAFARPVPVDPAGNKRPALLALVKYGQGVKAYCPTRRSGEAFASEIEQATSSRVSAVIPVLDEQAVLIQQ